MNLTVSSLLQSCLATLAYFILLAPAGYGLARLSNVAAFRTRSLTEQCLWSVSLSVPLGLVIANVVGRYLSPHQALALLASLSAVSLVSVFFQRGPTAWPRLDRYAKIVLLALLVEAVYIWCAGAPLQVGHRLYEPVFSGDWEIRFPLVEAAVRDGVPPHSPFFSFRGQSPPMRYYYYWYSVCGWISGLLHTSPRATLLASSVYVAASIIAMLFLYQKYLVISASSLRKRCVLLLGLCCVLGLDVVPSTLRLMFWRVHLLPEIEWWSQDRTPGLPGVIIYAPHHVGGAVCGLLAFLLLTLLLNQPQSSWRTVTTYAILIALDFTALVGTSTFICMFFAVGCTVFCLDRLRRGDALPAFALAGAAVLSVAVSAPYLHELLAKAVVNGASQVQHRHFLVPKLRDNNFAHSLIWKMFVMQHRSPPAGIMRFVYRLPVIPLLYLCEFGFFLIVLLVRYRQDIRSKSPLAPVTRALWLLVASVAFFFFFVSSEAVQHVNDLGLQAGIVLRLILIVWGAQVVAEFLELPRGALTPKQRWVVRTAYVFAALGLTMTVWQAVVERTYAVLADRHALPAISPFPYAYHVGAVYLDVYQAQAAVARMLPKDAVVQSDPTGRYQTIFRLYQTRRQAAADETCEGAFGGDPELCQSFIPAILHLFGSHPPLPDKRMHGPKPDPADMTPAAFAFVCAQDGITAIAASRADPVWYDQDSWVWRGNLLYGNNTVRVIRCPSQDRAADAHL